jgi:uncharacterized protein
MFCDKKLLPMGCLMNLLSIFDLSTNEWILVSVAAITIGLAKAGLGGLSMLVIPVLANVFGGKESTGVLLPMLIIGDFFAVWYYNRHADWKSIKKLLPWTFVGLILGTVVGNLINDTQFKMLIGVLVIVCLFLLLYSEKKKESLKFTENRAVYILSGISAGFATMIGNAAGPIFSVYLLASGFKKNSFIGTASWFFLIINLSKVPLQVFVWKNITLSSAATALILLPAIAVGVYVGTKIIKKINEKVFRYLIIVMTAIAAVRLFI